MADLDFLSAYEDMEEYGDYSYEDVIFNEMPFVIKGS